MRVRSRRASTRADRSPEPPNESLAVLAVLGPLRDRLPRAGDLAWLVLALFAGGRFFEFFLRPDSPELALGLSNAQWTSAAMLLAAIVGRTVAALARSGTFMLRLAVSYAGAGISRPRLDGGSRDARISLGSRNCALYSRVTCSNPYSSSSVASRIPRQLPVSGRPLP